MRTMKAILERLRIPAVLLAAISLVALEGCKGDTAAPFGSVVTLTETNRLFKVVSAVSGTPYTNQINCRASVADEGGLPLAGIEVKLDALITSGQDVTVYDRIGNAGDRISTILTMNNSGYFDFSITASDQALGALLSFPDPVTAIGLVSGGTLTAGPYQYTVSALDASVPALETVAQSLSTIVSNASTSNDSVMVSWTAVPGATSYRIYGRTSGSQLFLASQATTTTKWLDTGAGPAVGAVAPPALGSQPPGIAANALRIGLSGSSGAAIGTLDVSLY